MTYQSYSPGQDASFALKTSTNSSRVPRYDCSLVLGHIKNLKNITGEQLEVTQPGDNTDQRAHVADPYTYN